MTGSWYLLFGNYIMRFNDNSQIISVSFFSLPLFIGSPLNACQRIDRDFREFNAGDSGHERTNSSNLEWNNFRRVRKTKKNRLVYLFVKLTQPTPNTSHKSSLTAGFFPFLSYTKNTNAHTHLAHTPSSSSSSPPPTLTGSPK